MSDPKQITPNVYQLTRGANMFLLKTGEDELTLIDAGIPGARTLILKAISALGYAPNALKHILITHADIDHVGSLAGITTATGATVYASNESKPYIESASAPPHLPPVMRSIAGAMQSLIQKKTSVDQTFSDGEVLPIGGGIQAIYAPGHTPDNYIFYWQRADVLFAADLLNRMRGPLALSQPIITWDTEKTRQSARKALALQASIICVGHGDDARPQRDADQFTALVNSLA